MGDYSLHIGILTIEIMLSGVSSLKGKRTVLNSLKDKLRAKFNVSIAELGELDVWQRSICGISQISNSQKHLDQSLQKILLFLEKYKEIDLMDHQIEFL